MFSAITKRKTVITVAARLHDGLTVKMTRLISKSVNGRTEFRSSCKIHHRILSVVFSLTDSLTHSQPPLQSESVQCWQYCWFHCLSRLTVDLASTLGGPGYYTALLGVWKRGPTQTAPWDGLNKVSLGGWGGATTVLQLYGVPTLAVPWLAIGTPTK